MDTSPDYLMPNGGLSSSTAGGTRSGKHFSTRPELVVDGRTLGAQENGLLLYVADWAGSSVFRHLWCQSDAYSCTHP
jgi:hypothetical protein